MQSIFKTWTNYNPGIQNSNPTLSGEGRLAHCTYFFFFQFPVYHHTPFPKSFGIENAYWNLAWPSLGE